MKITKISGKTFDSLGTIFAYKERKFYLPKKEKLKLELVDLFGFLPKEAYNDNDIERE